MQAELGQLGAIGGSLAVVLLLGDRIVNWAVKLRNGKNGHNGSSGEKSPDFWLRHFDAIERGNSAILEELKELRKDMLAVIRDR